MKTFKGIWGAEANKDGLPYAILDRLRFHNGLSLDQLTENFGICLATARKHMARLVNRDLATNDSYNHWKPNR